MKEADRSENPGLGEKEGSITFHSLVSASAGGGHGELLSALTSGVPTNHVHTPPPRPVHPPSEPKMLRG